MAQVETLEIEHSFQEDVVNQASGRAPIDAKKLDQTLASVAENQNLINENLKMLQRDDGQLKDAVVGPAQMQRSLLNLVKEFNLRGAYVVATYYAKNDAVDYNGSLWVCSKPHNSTSVFEESNWLRYGASGAEDVSVSAQQAQQAATAAAASLRNANTAASTAETLKTQTEAAATNASNAANSAATQAQQVSQNAAIATSAKARAETAALKAEAAANSGAITTPKPIASASLAILTGIYYTSGNVPTVEQYKVDVIATDTQIIQTATSGNGLVWSRQFATDAISFPAWSTATDSPTVVSKFTNNVDTIAALIALSKPQNGQSAIVKSYSNAVAGGGGDFIYNASKSTINNGATVFNGWERKPKLEYTPEDAGAIADGVTDCTLAFDRLITALPENSAIYFAAGAYSGRFKSAKSFNLRFSENSKIIQTSGMEAILFQSISSAAVLVETSLVRGVNKITILGEKVINNGAIIVLNDGTVRTSDNALLNYESALVKSSVIENGNTTVYLSKPLRSVQNGIQITANIFNSPIVSPSITGLAVTNTDGANSAACSRFIGCLNPKVEKSETVGNVGAAFLFENCYSGFIDELSMSKPLKTNSGNGYGVLIWKSSEMTVGNLYGDGMRHVLDMDSAYGITVNYVSDDNPQNAIVEVAHNGFTGDISINEVEGYVQATEAYGVHASYAATAGRLTRALHGININRVKLTIAPIVTVDSLIRGVYLDAELGDYCKIGTVEMTFLNPSLPTASTKSYGVIALGSCKLLEVGRIKANLIGYPLTCKVNGSSQRGRVEANLDIGTSQYGVYLTGYDSKVACVYDKVNRDRVVEVAQNTVTGVQAMNVSVESSQRALSGGSTAQPVYSDVVLQTGGIKTDSTFMSSSISVSATVTPTAKEIQLRNGYITLSAGSGSATVTIPELPAPTFANGQRLTVGNGRYGQAGLNAIAMTAVGSMASAINLTSGKTVRLISISGKWRIES